MGVVGIGRGGVWGALWLAVALATTATAEPDFKAPVPPNGRSNPYELSQTELALARRAGFGHALAWPEIDHGLTLPYPTLDRVVRLGAVFPWAGQILKDIGFAQFGTTWEEFYEHLGLRAYPETEGAGAYFVPFPNGERPELPLGAAVRTNSQGVDVWSLGCASCHARHLFGKSVIGLSSLEPRPSALLAFGKTTANVPSLFVRLASANEADYQAFRDTQLRMSFMSTVPPRAFAVDTAMAGQALSHSNREPDEWGTMTEESRAYPRDNALWEIPTDAKPAVWWLAKYKNKFLHDGSVQGNPVMSNFISIEVMHGVELRNLAPWLEENAGVMRDLTAAVFAAEAPKWTDFFPASSIDVAEAKAGEGIFKARCERCHGVYEKGWNAPDAGARSALALLETTRVVTAPETFTVDVGTDPDLAEATRHVEEDLNRLELYGGRGIKMSHTGGYVPQPLVGIWARYPYFHNASAPTLCDVLTPSYQRPTGWYVSSAEVLERDYDAACVGLPKGERIARKWRTDERWYDTGVRGLTNGGHDEGIFLRDGVELLTQTEKMQLIEFLKTL